AAPDSNEWAAPWLPIPHHPHGGTPGPAWQGGRPGGDPDAPAVQSLHGLGPAVAMLPNQVLLRDSAVLEGQVGGRTCPQPEFRRRLDVGDLEPGCVLRHHEQGNPLVAARPRLPGVDLDEVRDAPVRDESLLAVEDPFVAF